MDLRQLRYFVTIVEFGSFSRAAVVLQVAQPALSLHVRNLESDLGGPLLIRTPQGVRPTATGEILCRNAQTILQHVEQTRAMILDFEGEPEGEFRLGLDLLAPTTLVRKMASMAIRAFPRVRVGIARGPGCRILTRLERHELDLALVYGPLLSGRGIALNRLWSERLCLVGPGLGDGHGRAVPLAHCQSRSLVLPGPKSKVRGLIDKAAAVAGIDVGTSPTIDSISGLAARLVAREETALLPQASAEALGKGRLLLVRPIGPPKLMVDLQLVHTTDRPLPPAACLLLELFLSSLTSDAGESTAGSSLRYADAGQSIEKRS